MNESYDDAPGRAVLFTRAELIRLGFVAWRCERGAFADDTARDPAGSALPRPIANTPTFPIVATPTYAGDGFGD